MSQGGSLFGGRWRERWTLLLAQADARSQECAAAYEQQASDFVDEAIQGQKQSRYMASVATDGRVRILDSVTGRFASLTKMEI